MRTTLTLDDDVADYLKQRSRHLNQPFKQVVNDYIRRGMAAQEGNMAPVEPFEVTPHDSTFRPGVDLMKLNQLVDEMEVDDFVQETAEKK